MTVVSHCASVCRQPVSQGLLRQQQHSRVHPDTLTTKHYLKTERMPQGLCSSPDSPC